MQKTLLIRGNISHEYRSPIDRILNSILQNQPEMRLEKVTVLNISETSCLLLCVFEIGDETKTKKNN